MLNLRFLVQIWWSWHWLSLKHRTIIKFDYLWLSLDLWLNFLDLQQNRHWLSLDIGTFIFTQDFSAKKNIGPTAWTGKPSSNMALWHWKIMENTPSKWSCSWDNPWDNSCINVENCMLSWWDHWIYTWKGIRSTKNQSWTPCKNYVDRTIDYGFFLIDYIVPSGYFAMENPLSMELFFNGKIIYLYGPCSTAMLNNQRVLHPPLNVIIKKVRSLITHWLGKATKYEREFTPGNPKLLISPSPGGFSHLRKSCYEKWWYPRNR